MSTWDVICEDYVLAGPLCQIAKNFGVSDVAHNSIDTT
jgi:hypothetical protein